MVFDVANGPLCRMKMKRLRVASHANAGAGSATTTITRQQGEKDDAFWKFTERPENGVQQSFPPERRKWPNRGAGGMTLLDLSGSTRWRSRGADVLHPSRPDQDCSRYSCRR